MTETTTGYETWTKDGRSFTLVPVDMAAREDAFLASLTDEEAEGYEPWYADFPGQLPPQAYELHDANGSVAWSRTVFPNEPWSPYDAVSDVLLREGYEPPPPTEEDLAVCEHGLSARLCAGPGHYPDDRFD